VPALAAAGWALEELAVSGLRLDVAAAAELAASPAFALRRLTLAGCGLDAAGVNALAAAAWSLAELDLSAHDFRAAAVGPALAALGRRRGVTHLTLRECALGAATVKALLEASWPELEVLDLSSSDGFDARALGASAFAGFPRLEALDLNWQRVGAAGAALLASRAWPRRRALHLSDGHLGAAGLAALARGAWPALRTLELVGETFARRLTLEEVRAWAPAIRTLTLDLPCEVRTFTLEDLCLD
jgi:hypothetical protein